MKPWQVVMVIKDYVNKLELIYLNNPVGIIKV